LPTAFGLDLMIIPYIFNTESASSLQLMNETDPLSFFLAYELLTSALLHEDSRRRDLVELIKCIRVAVIHYPLDAIKTHYDGKEQAVNEHICRALDGITVAVGETTLNFTIPLNGSFDVKTLQVPTMTKKRHSVSMFEEVEVQLVQQPQQNVRIVYKFKNIVIAMPF